MGFELAGASLDASLVPDIMAAGFGPRIVRTVSQASHTARLRTCHTARDRMYVHRSLLRAWICTLLVEMGCQQATAEVSSPPAGPTASPRHAERLRCKRGLDSFAEQATRHRTQLVHMQCVHHSSRGSMEYSPSWYTPPDARGAAYQVKLYVVPWSFERGR